MVRRGCKALEMVDSMLIKKRILLLVIGSLFVAGCNFPAKNEQNEVKESVAKAGEMKQSVVIIPKDALYIDGQIQVLKKNSTDYQSAKIEQLYFSALGQQCIQVVVIDNLQKRLFCQKSKTTWKEMLLLDNLVIEPIE